MDGTLAEWRVAGAPHLYDEGYFKHLRPYAEMVEAIKALRFYYRREVEVFILSAVLMDSAFAEQEKGEWLKSQFGAINTVFVPNGSNKAEFVPGGIKESDVLIDDFTKNLDAWEKQGGRGLKVLNGINNTKGTWKGKKIYFKNPSQEIVKAIYQFAAS